MRTSRLPPIREPVWLGRRHARDDPATGDAGRECTGRRPPDVPSSGVRAPPAAAGRGAREAARGDEPGGEDDVTVPGGELLVYRSDDGRTQVQLRAVQGTVRLTQAQIAELYATSVPNIAQIMRRPWTTGGDRGNH
jgi:hypothetical protein